MPDAGKLARGIPKSNFWASDPNGINQVGYVYKVIRPKDGVRCLVPSRLLKNR